VSTVEVEKARFINEIKLQSYGYAALMSVTFTAIVNRITHFHLKKINMIDSLKSVE
jgi:putative ABC transport system permease protein